MASEDLIAIRLILTGGTAAAAEAKVVSGEIRGIGAASAEASTMARTAGTRIGAAMGFIGTAARGGALALAAGVGAVGLATKGAVGDTEELARTTKNLNRNLGIGVQEASRWAAVAKARGIETTSFNMGLTTLSRNLVAAQTKGSAAATTFESIGVSAKDLQGLSFDQSIMKIADALGAMQGGAQRQAAAASIFGRSYQALLPLFDRGSKSVRHQLDLVDKYHLAMGTHAVDANMKLIKSQGQLKLAWMGFQDQLSRIAVPLLTKVMPILEDAARGVGDFLEQVRKGSGVGGATVTVFQALGTAISAVVGWVKGAIPVVTDFVDRLLHGGDSVGKFGQDIKAIALAVKDFGVWLFHVAKGPLLTLASGVKDVFGGIAKVIGGVVKIVGGILRGDWKDAWQGAKDVFSGAMNLLKGVGKILISPFKLAFNAIKSIVGGVINWIADKVQAIVDKITDAKNKLEDLNPLAGTHVIDPNVDIPTPDFSGTPMGGTPHPGAGGGPHAPHGAQDKLVGPPQTANRNGGRNRQLVANFHVDGKKMGTVVLDESQIAAAWG